MADPALAWPGHGSCPVCNDHPTGQLRPDRSRPARLRYPAAWAVIAATPFLDPRFAAVAVFAALALAGLVGGAENPNEMSLRQHEAPAGLWDG